MLFTDFSFGIHWEEETEWEVCYTRQTADSTFYSFHSSVRTDLKHYGANSSLFVAKVNQSDSGNYTCSIGSSQGYTVMVHVLNGK